MRGETNQSCLQVYPSWYALYTKHQHEKTVARNLLCKGFETFLPLYATAHDWKDRTKILYAPLFPCYVFIKGAIERRLDILTTPGVHALVSNGGQPAEIPAAEIEGIRQVMGSGAHVEPYPFLKCGDWVRVRCGPLAGIHGVLVRIKTIYRLVLSVEMLGKAAAVEIDAVLTERLNEKSRGVHGLSHGGPAYADAGNQQVANSPGHSALRQDSGSGCERRISGLTLCSVCWPLFPRRSYDVALGRETHAPDAPVSRIVSAKASRSEDSETSSNVSNKPQPELAKPDELGLPRPHVLQDAAAHARVVPPSIFDGITPPIGSVSERLAVSGPNAPPLGIVQPQSQVGAPRSALQAESLCSALNPCAPR